LEDVAGSGPLGRVTRADVLARAGLSATPSPLPGATVRQPRAPAPTRSAAAEPSSATAKGNVQVVQLTRLQTVVARRMAEAKATVPEFQVQTEVIMDAAIAFRAQIKASGADAPSFNDLIVKAAALALRRHPRANGSYRDGHFELYTRINVGIAVAAADTLIVPTIFDADQKSLGAISAESRRLAERVREGTITPPELSGATFTVSNLGMYGMSAITPVINAPQAAILGVGAMRPVLARVDGEILDRQLITLTLSCDHRILYGADAAEFLSEVRGLLEQPLQLVL
jgi:pyruvate dehydrogenase E2 component (dihydrolipoamide acetyltransferase)